MSSRRSLSIAGALALALALPFLVAQTGPSGGLPSKPRFQALGLGTPAPTTTGALSALGNTNAPVTHTIDNDSNGTANLARSTINSGDATGEFLVAGSGRTAVILVNGPTSVSQAALRTSTASPLLLGTNNTLAATISAAQVVDFVNTPTIASSPIIEGGTFTASFDDACTTTPTVTFDWQRAGNVVTLSPVSQSGFSCTGDSTSFATTGTPVPAALRPVFQVTSGVLDGFTNNSAATWAEYTIGTTGAIAVNRCSSLTADCAVTGWTAALNRAFALGSTVTYMLGNP